MHATQEGDILNRKNTKQRGITAEAQHHLRPAEGWGLLHLGAFPPILFFFQ